MKNIIICICLLCLISCTQTTEEKFSLTGKTSGVADGSVIQMVNLLSDETIDSAIINDNTFVFETNLKENPTHAFLRIKNTRDYKYVWLENNAMTLDASASAFKQAIVTGSATQDQNKKLDELQKGLSHYESLKIDKQFIKDNPNSLVSAYILSVYTTTWGKSETEMLFEGMTEEMKTTAYGKKIKRFIELSNEPEIGDPFVDFAMKDVNDQNKKLSESRGKITLLEFWAAWCGPCRQENPNLVKTYEKYNPKGFEVFAVSLDGRKDDWLQAIETDQLPWLHVSDLQGSDNAAGLIYGVNGIPDNFLIDEAGIVIDRNLRGDYLDQKLEELLGD